MPFVFVRYSPDRTLMCTSINRFFDKTKSNWYISFECSSSSNTKHLRLAAMSKLSLRNLSNAELLFSHKIHQSILQAPFSFPPPSKIQKVRFFGSKSSSQTIANRQEASFYAHQASNIMYSIIKTHLILLVFVLGSSIFRR